MRNHLSLQQIADTLGVKPTYAGQALDPALKKVATLYLDYPEQTLRMILDMAAEIRDDRRQATLNEERERQGRIQMPRPQPQPAKQTKSIAM